MDIPFEGIIAFFLFIIGVPAFVLQFISSEERRVVLRWRFWRDCFFFVILALGVVWTFSYYWTNIEDRVGPVWTRGLMYLCLFVIAGAVGIYIPNHYGRREKIVEDLKKQAGRSLRAKGRFDERALADLVGLGKQCGSGQEQELVLLALDQLVKQACSCSDYRAGTLETIIDETVNILISRPHPEDFQSFRTAVSLLRRIVTHDCTTGETENLVDHQRAVRALSALGQAVLSQVDYSIGIDYILMGYEGALSLALLNHPQLLTDVSQALFETGSVALDSKNYLFAVAALRRLLSIFEENNPVPPEASVDTLGLLAHFWNAEDSPSSRLFAEQCLERLNLKGEALRSALEATREHCQITMEFETADKIMVMQKDLQET